jgi:hypothetical protein
MMIASVFAVGWVKVIEAVDHSARNAKRVARADLAATSVYGPG